VVYGKTVKELFEDDEDQGEITEGNGLLAVRGGAKEVDEIPLCAHCYVEVGSEEMDTGTVVKGALRRMDYLDGGLSRTRYETGHLVTGDETRTRRMKESSATGKKAASLDPLVYASIHDPTGKSVFRPSPTKPIPSWMTSTSDQGDPAYYHGPQRQSRLDESLQRRHSSQPNIRISMPEPPQPKRPPTPPKVIPQPASPVIVTQEPIEIPEVFRYSRMGFIDAESVKRSSSRLDRIREESRHVDSRTPTPYLTPPEWPPVFRTDKPETSPGPLMESESQGPVAREREVENSPLQPGRASVLWNIPLQTQQPSTTLNQSGGLSAFSETASSAQRARLPKRSTMLRARMASHLAPPNGAPIPMNSEFLDRYGVRKGKKAPKPSALLKKTPPSSRRSSQEPQLILAKMARNSRSGPTTGPVDETMVVSVTDPSKQFSFDSATGSIALHDGAANDGESEDRRRSLQDGLRRLMTL
jgi:hypothetical protein